MNRPFFRSLETEGLSEGFFTIFPLETAEAAAKPPAPAQAQAAGVVGVQRSVFGQVV